MPEYKPLKYRDVVKILRNLGFEHEPGGPTSHQTWVLQKNNMSFSVTLLFHGTNAEFRTGTLSSIIRQSGYSREEFYRALKK